MRSAAAGGPMDNPEDRAPHKGCAALIWVLGLLIYLTLVWKK